MTTTSYYKLSRLLHTMAKYSQQPLLESLAGNDPSVLMRQWIKDARSANIPLPLVGTLSTVHLPSARVSARLVNLKDFTDDGNFLFSTDWATSQKGEDIRSNPWVALTFYHQVLDRSIRVQGKAQILPAATTEEYWQGQPQGFRERYAAFSQSEKVANRAQLEQRLKHQEINHTSLEVPHNFSRVQVVPDAYEFWQGREDGIADRLSYRRDREGWELSRLEP